MYEMYTCRFCGKENQEMERHHCHVHQKHRWRYYSVRTQKCDVSGCYAIRPMPESFVRAHEILLGGALMPPSPFAPMKEKIPKFRNIVT
jgi:hypothetical protein